MRDHVKNAEVGTTQTDLVCHPRSGECPRQPPALIIIGLVYWQPLCHRPSLDN